MRGNAEKNIVLCGFMASGKTTVGTIIAASTNLKFLDTDTLIEAKEKMAINDIFARLGEEYFRKREEETVNEISGKSGLVISTGGGIVLNPENIKNLKKSGKLYYLKASPEAILKRVDIKTRPLLKDEKNLKEKIIRILNERESFYAQCDKTINTDAISAHDAARLIIKDFKNEN